MTERQLINKPALNRHEIPFGVKDYLPPDSYKIKEIEDIVLDTFKQWGYSYVITPLLEYLPVYNNGDSGFDDDELVKVIERETGKTMVLRADFTPQLARIASSKIRSKKALKLSYSGIVVKHYKDKGKKEIYQAGIELMNSAGIEADAEIIKIAVQILKKLGIHDFVISLSHAGFINTVLANLALKDNTRTIIDSLIQKDYSSIDDVRGLSKEQRKILKLLFDLYGNPDDVLVKAKNTFKDRKYVFFINELRRITRIVEEFDANNKFILDLREMHSVDYHTGAVFQIFIPGYGEEIVNGGRYDGFLKKYGYDVPATGFGINLSALLNRIP
ncbi:MAG: ATP phosphoribosyltransferase regulatory subunit [Deltaproteobacteria bacterium]|nr:ATP phosphoribosyltransferase regulatory subunit [Deltaproteobacteria bacterium]MCL5878769.1 ATP phosphoribosyltransferase regulatory subunit [Deltaproteobacteria bacterium]